MKIQLESITNACGSKVKENSTVKDPTKIIGSLKNEFHERSTSLFVAII